MRSVCCQKDLIYLLSPLDPMNGRVLQNVEKYETLLVQSTSLPVSRGVGMRRPNSTALRTRNTYERLCQTRGSQVQRSPLQWLSDNPAGNRDSSGELEYNKGLCNVKQMLDKAIFILPIAYRTLAEALKGITPGSHSSCVVNLPLTAWGSLCKPFNPLVGHERESVPCRNGCQTQGSTRGPLIELHENYF